MRFLTQRKKGCLLITLGVLNLSDYVIVRMLHGGVNLGTLFPGVFGIFLVSWGALTLWLKQWPQGPTVRRWRRIAITFVSLWLISFMVIEGFILHASRSNEDIPVDYLVILGAGLNGDQLSWTLYERVNKGLAYLQQHPDVKVVLSGGKGSEETLTEAEGMKRFLVAHGISEPRILKEEQSTSTFENFRYTKEVLRSIDGQRKQRIMIITSEFHMFRAKFLAERNGFIPYGITSNTPYYLLPNAFFREYFAVVKSFLFDR